MTQEAPEPALLPVVPADIRAAALAELARLTELVDRLQIERQGRLVVLLTVKGRGKEKQ